MSNLDDTIRQLVYTYRLRRPGNVSQERQNAIETGRLRMFRAVTRKGWRSLFDYRGPGLLNHRGESEARDGCGQRFFDMASFPDPTLVRNEETSTW